MYAAAGQKEKLRAAQRGGFISLDDCFLPAVSAVARPHVRPREALRADFGRGMVCSQLVMRRGGGMPAAIRMTRGGEWIAS